MRNSFKDIFIFRIDVYIYYIIPNLDLESLGYILIKPFDAKTIIPILNAIASLQSAPVRNSH